MNARTLLLFTVPLLPLARRADAQLVRDFGGEVSRSAPRPDASRLAEVPSVASELRSRVRIAGDSAQRIAMHDFGWHGRVASLEADEEDARVFWDVKIVPDTSQQTIIRYRVDATSGGIMNVKEFTGLRGLAKRP